MPGSRVRTKKGSWGVGLRAAIFNGAMRKYLTDKIKVEQGPKGLRREL